MHHWKCSACYTCTSILSLTRLQKSICTLYTSAHYNRDYMVTKFYTCYTDSNRRLIWADEPVYIVKQKSSVSTKISLCIGNCTQRSTKFRLRFRRRMWINGHFRRTFGFGRKQSYHIRCTFSFVGLHCVNSVVGESRSQSLSCGGQSAPDWVISLTVYWLYTEEVAVLSACASGTVGPCGQCH